MTTDSEAAGRWSAIERLCTDVRCIAKLDPDGRDDWAKTLVQSEAFLHVETRPACAGYTLASSGRASCGACGWRMSARMVDAGTAGGARFALAALARVGEAVERAWRSTAEAVLAC